MGAVCSVQHAMKIIGIRLPIDWHAFGLPDSFVVSGVVVGSGARGWAWKDRTPGLGVESVAVDDGESVPGWGLDHVVVLVPDLDDAIEVMAAASATPRKRVIVRERPTAFFLVGPLLEMIGEPSVDRALLWGIALETEAPLAAVAEAWRASGFDVSDPRPAYQEGRSIITVRDAGAGLAVMTQRERSDLG